LVEQLANSLWKIRDEITPQFLEMDAAWSYEKGYQNPVQFLC
jgi:hypothetical protein